ncbi:MAG: molybdopterin-dependent oxidoreductase [Pelagimonas sp.]|jgi:isoquinoline 1-oxidoreductase beta subunit|nr:molybdopterin-dependent oxidoreductase [Pelagimonas sp.]
MAKIGKIIRRSFLFGAVAIAGGAAFGAWYVAKPAPNPLKPGEGEATLSPYVFITPEGIQLVAPHAEMGQGVMTTWAALLAEELDVTLDQVKVIHGPPAAAYFNTALLMEGLNTKGYDDSAFQHAMGEMMSKLGKVLRLQVTGGSTAMRDGYEKLRVAGASAREMLKDAAAKQLGVSASALKTEAGQVIAPDGTALRYEDLALAATEETPRDVELRPRSEWKILGQAQPRVDLPSKSTGTATFGIDVRLPRMKYASVRMSPRRGTMEKMDGREALKLPGVEKVIDLGDGYAVVATNTWLAIQALDAVEVEWGDQAPYPHTTEEIFASMEVAFLDEESPNSVLRDDGDVTTMPEGATVVEAEYRTPFLTHATMEPMNATAWFDGPKLRVWSGNQGPLLTRDACAAEAGIDAEDVILETTLMGGGFGRRGELDFTLLATRVAKALPGTPVQVTWSREEDMTHDFYRPGSIARMKGGVKDGKAVLLSADIAAPSVTASALNRWMGFAPSGPDRAITDAYFNAPYGIENMRVRGFKAEANPPMGFWRSVGASHNGFYLDGFMDELAVAAGEDPLAFRMAMTRDEWEPAYAVLEAVRDMSGWTGQTPDGVGRGVSFVYSFGCPVAMVIEVKDEDGLIRLTNSWIAADPGVALDPGIVETQLTGGMAFGLSAAIGEEITFDDGIAQQSNFFDHEHLRMSMMPPVQVKILENQERISGIGEPGTPPAAPALANALFDLTGQRIRELPLNKHFDFYS